jgi:biotin transporter BioY
MSKGMGGADFTLALTVGAILLAGWLDIRFGKSRPDEPMRRIVHAVVAVIVLQLSIGALYLVDGTGAPRSAFLLAVLTLFLPALVYALLTGSWVMRTLAEIARLARR